MTSPGPAIEATNITRKFHEVTALETVSLAIKPGTICALLGANGAGKTTLMSILAGHDRPTSGTARIGNHHPFESEEVAAQTSFIRDNQRYPDNYFLHHALRSASVFHTNWDEAYAQELTKIFKLPARTQIHKFSRGQLSALAIVLSLASRAPFTIFDEPYLGLDIAARNRFYELLIEDYADHPRTIIVSTHLVGEMENIFEQAVILDRGKVVLDDPVDELRASAYSLTGPSDAVQNLSHLGEVLRSTRMGALTTAVMRGNPLEARAAAETDQTLSVAPVTLQDLVAAIGGDYEQEEAA